MVARTSLVIPVADERRNPTLSLVLETAERHAAWLEPILIGPPWLEPYTGGIDVIPFRQPAPNDPVGNTTRMLLVAVEDPAVTDPFVWSNDDIYFLAPTTLDDIREAGATARGKLRDSVKTGRYGRLAHETAALLEGLHRPTFDYERHVPLLVHKDAMRTVLALTGSRGNPRSLYQNSRLDTPAFTAPDVKAFGPRDLTALPPGKFLSTGNGFPGAALRHALGL